jgi:hypothetical protein
VWPVCPEVCPFFEETTDFPSGLLAKRTEERIVDKEPLATPEKQTLVVPEIADVSMIQRPDEKATLEPEKILKEVEETIQGIDQMISDVQIRKLKRSLGKQIKERSVDKEPLAIPKEETLVIPERDVSIIQRPDEKASLEPEKVLKEVRETIQRTDRAVSETQIRKLKRLSKKKGLPVSEPMRDIRSGHYVDIWSEKEVVSYLNDLIQKGSVKKCSKLKLEEGYLNAYYPRCVGGYASREVAHNVKISPKGDSAPRNYVWPVCPEVCPFFEETTDFPSGLLAKPIEERIVDNLPLAIPEVAEVSTVQKHEEKRILEPQRILREDEEITRRVDQPISEVLIKKLKKLSRKTGLPVSEHIERAIDEYLSKQETENK